MNNKIDAVILYVNMSDIEWQKTYNNFIRQHNIPHREINNAMRFRDYGTLKCVFRSIEMYANWINNVFLVVQSYSQVPDWVDQSVVKIVLHEDIIPKEFLPTFNCNTIETHLHFIPGLSEKFIYFNDDTLFNNMTSPEDFFINDKTVNFLIDVDTNRLVNAKNGSFYQRLRFNNVKVLNNIFPDISLNKTFFNNHGPTPMLKSLCTEIYNKIDIKQHISPFRQLNNLTQELFTVYAFFKRRLIKLQNASNDNITVKNTGKNIDDLKINLFGPNKLKQICVNDDFDNNENELDGDLYFNNINTALKNRYNFKSRFEK